MRLASFALLLAMGCSGCVTSLNRSVLESRHSVRVLWVHDSVMAQLQTAAEDSVESIFQVTNLVKGQLGPPAIDGDSGFVITGVVRCPVKDQASATRVLGECPNPHAPTIHVHTYKGTMFGATGNTCSPSRTDYTSQLAGRHAFDAIICGPHTRPTVYWFALNPLLGTRDWPISLQPAGPDRVAVVTP